MSFLWSFFFLSSKKKKLKGQRQRLTFVFFLLLEFKKLLFLLTIGVLVVEQGSILDRVDVNIQEVAAKVDDGESYLFF